VNTPILATTIAVLLAVAVGCDNPAGPGTGQLQVTVATTGADLDPDGYSLSLDGAPGLALAANDTRTLPELTPGPHSLLVSGIASNCALNGVNPRLVNVGRSDTTRVSLVVVCSALPALNIAGLWDWTEQYTNPVCNDTGTYAFTQVGATFTGRSDQVGSCQTPNGIADNTRSGDPVSAGQVAASTITFQVGSGAFCFYTATIGGDPPDHLSGTTTCGASTGTWQAVRAQPVASVTVTPPQDTVLEGATVQLAVQLRDAAGHRVFRTVTWSSDQAGVAVVSDSGKVTTGSAGTATITASAAGASGSARIIVQRAGAARVTTTTTGVDLDLDGYRAYVDGSFDGSQAVGINGTVLLTRIRPGSRTIQLGQVASNCSVTGTNPVAITVAGGDTIPVAFTVSCVRAQRIAFASGYNVGIYVMNVSGADAAPLISSATSVDYGRPTWSPDGARIAFHSARDGNEELYVMNGDGSGLTRLTNNAAFDMEPAWSPDGTKIAFTSNRDGQNEIYVMNPDGSGVSRVSGEQADERRPAWSPDGTRIAFMSSRDGHDEVYVMNADGSGITRLTNAAAGNFDPAWSPDGTRIVFGSMRDGNSQLYVMNADGSGVTRLSNNSDSDFRPAWSPDGSRIAFGKNVQGCDYYDCWNFTSVYVMNADGSGVTQLIGTFTGLDSDPAWRP
jgi:WD40-like Beta Propeller Repeat/Bacterial Ig-like domain (group 2)